MGGGDCLPKKVFDPLEEMMARSTIGHEVVGSRTRKKEDCKMAEGQRTQTAEDRFVLLIGPPQVHIRSNCFYFGVPDLGPVQRLVTEDWVALVSILIC